jgi:hypothetical protein
MRRLRCPPRCWSTRRAGNGGVAPMQVQRNRYPEAGRAGRRPLQHLAGRAGGHEPRPDHRPGPGHVRRHRRAAAGPGLVTAGNHRQWRPADPADDAAGVRPALATDLPGGAPWPISPSTNPGPMSPGQSSAANRPASTSHGRWSPGRAKGSPTRGALGVCRSLLYGSSGGRTTSALYVPTSGAGSPAKRAGDPAPYVGEEWTGRGVREQTALARLMHRPAHLDRVGVPSNRVGGAR